METDYKDNSTEKKVKQMSEKKRMFLTSLFVVLIVLSMACFYGAYHFMFGEGGSAFSSTGDSSSNIQSQEQPEIEGIDLQDENANADDAETTDSDDVNTTVTETVEQEQDVLSISITGWGDKTMVYEPGDTVYSVLARCGAPIYVEDTVYGLYVVGINGLMEGDKGPSSGWIYTVNGSMPSMTAGKYKVHPGDKIVWKFVS